MGIDLARTRTFSAFRPPNFRRYWWGAVVSMVGTWVQGTALTFFVWELTHSPLATSLPTFFFGVPTMVLSLFGGVLADRVDRRRLLITTQALFAVQAAALGAVGGSGRGAGLCVEPADRAHPPPARRDDGIVRLQLPGADAGDDHDRAGWRCQGERVPAGNRGRRRDQRSAACGGGWRGRAARTAPAGARRPGRRRAADGFP